MQDTLRQTALVASDLEAELGIASIAQEKSRVIVEKTQRISEQAIKETKTLQTAQQATAAELKDEDKKIGF